jgi:hypothetical protein
LKFRKKANFFTGQLFTLGNPEDVPAEDFVADQDVVMLINHDKIQNKIWNPESSKE